MSAIPLTQLQPGLPATISEVHADPAETIRLMGLGICAGRRLHVLKAGDPLILRVYGTRVGLAASLAAHVHVQTQSSAAVAQD